MTYLDEIFNERLDKLRSHIGEENVCFIVDETTDLKGRYVLNIMVGKLDGRVNKPMLLSTIFLTSTCHEHVMDAFDDSLSDLWPNSLKRDRVRLVVTDQGPNVFAEFKK